MDGRGAPVFLPLVVYDSRMAPGEAKPASGVRLPPLLLLFFLSGFSALVYQVLWMRLLALVFGVTIHAASTVLAAFMAGLALGSAAAGRLADCVRRPLVVFAAAEAGVAAAALATPLALAGVEALYVRLYGVLDGWPVVVGMVRFALSFAVLVVPTTLMGATLPLVVKSALARGSIPGRQVSLLYAGNTAGAVSGTLVAGIWMVPQLGISWAFRIAAIVNLLVAGGAFVISRRADASRAAVAPTPAGPVPAATITPTSEAVRRLVLFTFAVSGFVSFGLEIIWFRMLILLFRPTTYAFTVMLATVLAGIAIGSWLSTPVTGRRRVNLVGVLAVLELLLALAAVISMWLMGHAGPVFIWAGPIFAGTPLAYIGPLAVTSIVSIFPAALLMGMAFPIGISLWVSTVSDEHSGERVGVIYAVNVAGAVAGSLLTGFVLLPAIGSRDSLLLTSGLALGTGLLLLTQFPRRVTSIAVGSVAVGAFAFVAWKTPIRFSSSCTPGFPASSRLASGGRACDRRHPAPGLAIRADRTRALHQRHAPGERHADDGGIPPADRHAAGRDPPRAPPGPGRRRRRGGPRRAPSPRSAITRVSTSSSSRRPSSPRPASSAASTRTC